MEKDTMKAFEIDRNELQLAVDNKKDKEIYRLLKKLCNTMGYKHHKDYDDWRQIAITRAFNALSSYDQSKGAAFSYLYKVLKNSFLYEYRAEKRRVENRKELCALDDNISYEQEFYGDQELIMIGDRIFEKDDIRKKYPKTEWHRREKFRSQLE